MPLSDAFTSLYFIHLASIYGGPAVGQVLGRQQWIQQKSLLWHNLRFSGEDTRSKINKNSSDGDKSSGKKRSRGEVIF